MSSETSQTRNDKPVKVFRHGPVQISIWKSHNNGRAYYNAKMEHRYNANKGEGEADWKSSEYINERDMPAAAILWQRASNYIAFVQEKK